MYPFHAKAIIENIAVPGHQETIPVAFNYNCRKIIYVKLNIIDFVQLLYILLMILS